MRFSYTLIKKLVSGVNPVRNRVPMSRTISNGVKSKQDLVDKLNLHSFEVEDVGGDVFEVSIPPNRFSDAASHWGIAKEISAIYGRNFQFPISIRRLADQFSKKIAKPIFKVKIQDKNLCSRYSAQYFEDIKVKPSPKWLQKILIDCGLRPINNVVDIVNYAMLETGQPLHAFDLDKIESMKIRNPKSEIRNKLKKNPSGILRKQNSKLKTIIVRRAKRGEKITTLDNQVFKLNENILVIADEKEPLAIAGIKGGKKAEVDENTKRIIVEAANFDAVNIYKSSKALKLFTDASSRFSHNISPELALLGLNKAGELLSARGGSVFGGKEIAGAKAGQTIDINFTKPIKKIIKFNLEKFNKFIGLNFDSKTCQNYFKRLGFQISQQSTVKSQQSFFVEIPPLRQDIETFEDLAEEVARLYGYNRIKSTPALIHLIPSGFEDQIVLKDKARIVLVKMGLNEVYNYSFISKKDGEKFVFAKKLIELENPISGEFYYLRPSLAIELLKNVENNFKLLDEIRIFEIGKTFAKENDKKITERLVLGVAFASKSKETFFELKGVVRELFGKCGLVDYLIAEPGDKENDWVKNFTKEYLDIDTILKIESGDAVFGYLGQFKNSLSKWKINLFEIDLDVLLKLVVEEHEYRPLPKYPSIMRDISILVEPTIRVGEMMQAIQLMQTSADYTQTNAEIPRKSASRPRKSALVEDVDLIDEYEFEGKRSLAFRIIFQAEDRTLTDDEVDGKMDKISETLKKKFGAVIR